MAADPVPPSVPLEGFAGTYENPLYGRVDVIVEGESLRLEAGPAGWPAELRHFSRDTFLLDWGTVATVPEPTMFVVGPEGIAVAFENEGFGRFDRVGDE
jgi:hypothetical protein